MTPEEWIIFILFAIAINVIIPMLILIVLIFADYLITEFKFLIIMLKIKSCERLCKKAKKELLEIREVKKND